MTNYDQYSASWPRLVNTLEKLRKNPSLKHLTQVRSSSFCILIQSKLHNGMDLLQRLSMPLAYFLSLRLLAEVPRRDRVFPFWQTFRFRKQSDSKRRARVTLLSFQGLCGAFRYSSSLALVNYVI